MRPNKKFLTKVILPLTKKERKRMMTAYDRIVSNLTTFIQRKVLRMRKQKTAPQKPTSKVLRKERIGISS